MRHFRNIFSLLLISLFASCIQDDADEMVEYVKVGDPVPHFVATLADGTTYDSSLRDGRGATIIFFSTNCSDCQRELPLLDARYRQGEYEGQHVLCISRDEAPGAVLNFWRDNHLSLPVSPQTDRRIYNLFANMGVPRIYTIDPQGIITHIQLAE